MIGKKLRDKIEQLIDRAPTYADAPIMERTERWQIRGETFDNFLDHAVAYRDCGGKDQAGVIAGVVFEDTMRKIYAARSTRQRGPNSNR